MEYLNATVDNTLACSNKSLTYSAENLLYSLVQSTIFGWKHYLLCRDWRTTLFGAILSGAVDVVTQSRRSHLLDSYRHNR